ncbi:hypothetical protein [Algicola sagamiensis]|nr:hypothetical protein [Algicola sagamiensis]
MDNKALFPKNKSQKKLGWAVGLYIAGILATLLLAMSVKGLLYFLA